MWYMCSGQTTRVVCPMRVKPYICLCVWIYVLLCTFLSSCSVLLKYFYSSVSCMWSIHLTSLMLPSVLMASDNIKTLSANVRGLRQTLKRKDMFDYFNNQNADILCLQETHLVQGDVNFLIKDWNLTYYLAGTSTNSKGVAILLNKTFEHTISSVYFGQ